MFTNLPPMEMIPTGTAIIILFLIGFKAGSLFSTKRSKREQKRLDQERESSSRSYKKLLDEGTAEVLSENLRLKEINAQILDKLTDYRLKIAGIGRLSFIKNRRRAEMLYTLLLENEALEQILSELGKKDSDDQSDYLLYQAKDLQKRHRLLAKIFDGDDLIKHHVQQVLFQNQGIERNSLDRLSDGVVENSLREAKGTESL